MIISIFNQGKGQAGPIIDYLFNEEKHKNFKPQLMSGNPAITKEVVASISRKHKYTTGVISFKEGESLTEAQQHALINEFENTFAPFQDPARSNFLWVRHMDKNRLELHFVHCMIDLKSGLQFNISPSGKVNQDFYKKFQSKKNYEFGFKQVGKKNKDGITEITPLKFQEYKQVCREVNQYIDKRIEFIILNIDNKKLGLKIKKEKSHAGIKNSGEYKIGINSNGREAIIERKLNSPNNRNAIPRANNDIVTPKGNCNLAPSNIRNSKSRLRNNDTRREEQNNNVQSNAKAKNEVINPMSMQGYSLLSIDQKLIALVKSMETCPAEQLGQIYEELGKLRKQKEELGYANKPRFK
ncbi:MAG TPA: hypothetical protein DCF99_07430 [Flavobacteriaceae bacterium]|nr:hypothetical protein [Flavobacteriaceae bacterium]